MGDRDGRNLCAGAAHTVPRTFLFKYFCILAISCWSKACVCAWCRCLASTCKSQDAAGMLLCTEQSCYRRMTCTPSSVVSSFPECLKAIGVRICFPSSQCCQHSEILTGATVTITDTVCPAGCQSLFDHQNTNYTWLFSSRIVICIPKCTM